MSLVKFLDLSSKIDSRGHLGFLESKRHIPFEIKRIYYLKNLDRKEPRGFHAHRNLTQAAICISGSYEMILDDGKDKESVFIDSSNKPLFIEPLIWHEMRNFSQDCIILFLASDYYSEEDYIRDYHTFLKIINERL